MWYNQERTRKWLAETATGWEDVQDSHDWAWDVRRSQDPEVEAF